MSASEVAIVVRYQPASSDGDTVRVSCRDAADRVTATGQIS